MKGVVLCGGLGTRLEPLTKVTNKHLLPVYDRPMVFYPLQTLQKAGIKEVMVVVAGEFAGDFIRILKNGEEFGFTKLVYGYQEKPNGGIADALRLAEDFADGDDITVVLGDNTTNANISFLKEDRMFHPSMLEETPRAHLFLKKVTDPHRFGVPTISNNKIIEIIEKPAIPKSDYAITGMYIYDKNVFNYIKKSKPSERGELEITDINNLYIENGEISYTILGDDIFWKDAGTFGSLFEASKYWKNK